jgi:hypothetical protein
MGPSGSLYARKARPHVVLRRVVTASGRRLLTVASRIHGGVQRKVARSRILIRAGRNCPTRCSDDGPV